MLFVIVLSATGLAFSSPRPLALVFATAAVVVPVVLWMYAQVGLIVVPFRESYLCGVMNLFLPFYGLYYLVSRWDVMRGVFFACIAAVGIVIVPATFLPAVAQAHRSARAEAPNTGRRAQRPLTAPSQAARQRDEAAPIPAPGFPGLIGTPPGWLAPGVPAPPMQSPDISTSISLLATGLNDQPSRQAFGDKLGELARKVSGGFLISSSASGGKSTYSVSMVNPVDVQTFADQITWAKVTKIAGQTITIDATAGAGLE
jgi:hypothetical protein